MLDRYVTADFETLGFHDCKIHGIDWRSDDFGIAFMVDYIVEWVHPGSDQQHFQFWMRPAVLVFSNVDDVEIALNWKGLRLECCIDELCRGPSRVTPNGTTQWKWSFSLSEPSGAIDLWATGFELAMLGPAVKSDVARLTSVRSYEA
ncbi:MAG TPA: hypothetical protein VIK18_11805 [Pirellulales bacterium]